MLGPFFEAGRIRPPEIGIPETFCLQANAPFLYKYRRISFVNLFAGDWGITLFDKGIIAHFRFSVKSQKSTKTPAQYSNMILPKKGIDFI